MWLVASSQQPILPSLSKQAVVGHSFAGRQSPLKQAGPTAQAARRRQIPIGLNPARQVRWAPRVLVMLAPPYIRDPTPPLRPPYHYSSPASKAPPRVHT
jgi:hypothetical protein